MKFFLFISLSLMLFSCSMGQYKEEPLSFEFAIYKNEPVNEDRYLYPKTLKNGLKISKGNLVWYLIDWDQNGIFSDSGIDYYGVQSPFRALPILKRLEDTSFFRHNTDLHMILKSSKYRDALNSTKNEESIICYFTDFIPIELSDGTKLDSSILQGH